MCSNLFCGCATALITPFHAGQADYAALEKLMDRQIEESIDALVLLGTTGEPCTITESERSAIIECAAARCAGRVPLIVGTGSNCTDTAIALSRNAERLGADALLIVTPYYNKGNIRGMEEHFRHIADSVEIPIILYDVPSRTGIHMPPQIAAALAEHPMIRGYKMAHSSVSEAMRLFELADEKLQIYCGNDDMILPMLAMGACGSISVVSNLLPRHLHDMCIAFSRGEIDACRRAQMELMPLIRALFAEVNPIGAKAALHMMGLCDDELRLPLAPMDAHNRDHLRDIMRDMGLIALTRRG